MEITEQLLQQRRKNAQVQQALADNSAELARLNGALQSTISELRQLDAKLKNAPKDIAFGNLTSDDYLSYKTDYATRESELKDIKEAITAQNEARAMLTSQQNDLRHSLNLTHKMIVDSIINDSAEGLIRQNQNTVTNLVMGNWH